MVVSEVAKNARKRSRTVSNTLVWNIFYIPALILEIFLHPSFHPIHGKVLAELRSSSHVLTGSIRFLESLFLPGCLGKSPEQYRHCDRHYLLALVNLPGFIQKFWSQLTLVMEKNASEGVSELFFRLNSMELWNCSLENPWIRSLTQWQCLFICGKELERC